VLLRILPLHKGQLRAELLRILLSQNARSCQFLQPPVKSIAALEVVVAAAAAAAAAADAAVAALVVVTSLSAPLTFSSAWRLQHHLLWTAPAAVKEVSSKRPAE